MVSGALYVDVRVSCTRADTNTPLVAVGLKSFHLFLCACVSLCLHLKLASALLLCVRVCVPAWLVICTASVSGFCGAEGPVDLVAAERGRFRVQPMPRGVQVSRLYSSYSTIEI